MMTLMRSAGARHTASQVHPQSRRFSGIRTQARRAKFSAGLRVLAFTFAALVLGALPARAALQIDITQGNVDPLPVAIPGFLGASDEDRRLGSDIASVIAANLARCPKALSSRRFPTSMCSPASATGASSMPRR